MFLFLKKKADDAPETPAPSQSTPTSEFIPYYCHWDAHTLLTKNGELMQTIRISGNARGLDYESGNTKEGDSFAVREALRLAVADAIGSDKFALWIHTVRKRRRFHYAVEFKDRFAAWAHEQWRKKSHWKYQYYNEIYISVIHEGQDARLLDKHSTKHIFPLKRNRQYRNDYLEKAAADLDRTVAALLEKLRTAYNVHLLSVIERPGSPPLNRTIFYSEPMEFLNYLINLRDEPCPLTEADMSQALTQGPITFGFNALEAKTHGKRRFAAMLTLKQYCEIPPDTADRVLQAPMEFVISQAFHFIPSKQALAPYKEQKNLFEVSGDIDSIAVCGIDDIMSSDRKRTVDFGEHQVSIMVLGDDYKHLDSEVAHIKDGFGDFGLIPIREDIKLEECFWAQLPGNFEFIRRKSTINTARIGGLCRLNRFSGGQPNGNHWGPAVTLAPTIVNSPYFFNFHQGDNGHTVLLDFNSFHDQTAHILTNFLLTESRKFGGRLCVFDRNQSSHLLLSNLGGQYHTFPTPPAERHPSLPPPSLKLNPFRLPDNPRNRGFLLAWCATLMAPAVPTDPQKETLRAAIAQLYAGAPEQRHLPALIQHLLTADPNLAKAFSPWHGDGKHYYLFDSAADNFSTSVLMNGFDMTPVVQYPATIIPVFSYLMHKLITSLDGLPTIIVLQDALDLIENAFFAPRLDSLLEMLKQNNAMVIFTVSNPFSLTGTRSFNTIMQNCPTHLYLPDDIHLNYTSQNLGLGDNDARFLRRMKRQKGEFLVKQNGESTGLRIDFAGLAELRAILANDSKDLTAATNR